MEQDTTDNNATVDDRPRPGDFKAMSYWAATWWFWSVVVFFAVLWVVLPTVFQPAYRPDVIELQLIGKEWVLATRKHPMLPAWFLESVNHLTNRTFAAPFLASQLCILLALWSVWTFGRKVLSERLALIGTFAMMPYWFFTVESAKFNQNIPLIAFWSLTVLLVYRAFQTNRFLFWAGAGLTLGLAFHSKYSAIFLVFAILSCMVFHPKWRKLWKSPGPYMTTLIAFLVFLPHIIWMYQDGFTTLAYAQSRQVFATGFLGRLTHPLTFLLCEAVYLVLPILILIPILGWRWKRKQHRKNPAEKDGEQYLFHCIGVPLGLHLLISGAANTALLADYGAAFWPFFGIFLLLRFQTDDRPATYFRSFRGVLLAELLMICIFLGQTILSPYLTGTTRRFHFPMRSLGAECDRIWSSRFPKPCPYLSGDWWLAGNAAYSMEDRPSVHFYYGDINDPQVKSTGTWSQDSEVNEHGGILLWQLSVGKNTQDETVIPQVPKFVALRFPRAEVLSETLTLPYQTGANVPPLKIGVAVIPPNNNETGGDGWVGDR